MPWAVSSLYKIVMVMSAIGRETLCLNNSTYSLSTMLSDFLARVLIDNSVTLLITGAVAALVLYLYPSKSNLPLVNGKRPWEFRFTNARKRFLTDAHTLIRSGLAKVCVSTSDMISS